jgi:hypothetical protein
VVVTIMAVFVIVGGVVIVWFLLEARQTLINKVNDEVSGKIIDWKYERAKKAAEKERSERQ